MTQHALSDSSLPLLGGAPAAGRAPRRPLSRGDQDATLSRVDPNQTGTSMAKAPEPAALPPEDARDLALLAAHRAGDRDALAELLERYQDRLFGVCLRMTGKHEYARDLTQDAMVKIIQGLDQFHGRSKLSTWLIRVTMNVCLTSLRKEKLRRHASLDMPVSGSSGSQNRGESRTIGTAMASEKEPGAHERVEQSEDRRALYEGLARLDAHQRAILILRDVQGLDYRQIAEILEVPEGTVKSRLFRARDALRQEIEAVRRRPDDARLGATQGE